MKFVDQVKVYVKAGDGGRGCVSFRREKFVPRGGPNGGDGGRGGHVIFRATKNMNTLLDIRYQQQYRAQKGQHGMGSDMHGKNGEDLVIPVPVGTLIMNEETKEVLHDLIGDGEEYIAARGGRGGLGNTHFKSATRQAPNFPIRRAFDRANVIRYWASKWPKPPLRAVVSLNAVDPSQRQQSDTKSVGTGCQLWLRKMAGVL